MKKMDKKGFTLAELLIVVAIIAVLTAIAVPLFVSALDNAKDSVKAANIRAVRGEAVSYILTADSKDEMVYIKHDGTEKLSDMTDGWDVTAKVDQNGKITELTIKPCSGASDVTDDAKEDSKVWNVTLHIGLDKVTKGV